MVKALSFALAWIVIVIPSIAMMATVATAWWVELGTPLTRTVVVLLLVPPLIAVYGRSTAAFLFRCGKRAGARLPAGIQGRLKALLNAYRIRHGTHRSTEPEWSKLGEWLKPGDVALDIGANCGQYALEMARIVGPTGRVYAFEPLVSNSDLLRRNIAVSGYQNVTPMRVAVSDRTGTVMMSVPAFRGSTRAHVGDSGEKVLAITIDGMNLERLDFVKIDVEGHELPALMGARRTLKKFKPMLIVERNDKSETAVDSFLRSLGYVPTQIEGSPNTVYAAA